MAALKLHKLGPGSYQTPDGRYSATRLWSDGYGWSWFIHDHQDRARDHFDPTMTLAEAREAIAAEIAHQSATPEGASK